MASTVSGARPYPARNNGRRALLALAAVLLAVASAGPVAAENDDLLQPGVGPLVWVETAADQTIEDAFGRLPPFVKGGLVTFLLACAGLIDEECVQFGPQLCLGFDASVGLFTDPRTPVIYVKAGFGAAGVYAGYSERC